MLLSFPSSQAQESAIVHKDPYKKWLDEEVRWVITDQERADLNKLATDKQRDEFVIAFWDRRNPIPGAPENAFKEEHYRRLAYANQHFAAGVPGWKTDRGRFYIMFGPPDKIERDRCSDKMQPDSIRKNCFAFEKWHWAYIEDLGCDVVLEFVDDCRCGEYHLTNAENGMSHREVWPSLLHRFGSTCLIDQIVFP